MSRLTRDGTAEPVSRDQILRHARGQENINFPCSADHEQDWQPYPVDPYSAICDDHTYIHTYIPELSMLPPPTATTAESAPKIQTKDINLSQLGTNEKRQLMDTLREYITAGLSPSNPKRVPACIGGELKLSLNNVACILVAELPGFLGMIGYMRQFI